MTRSSGDAKIELVWEDPPAQQGRGAILFASVLEEVKKRPNKWARIRVVKTAQTAHGSRSVLKRNFKEPNWEFKVFRISETEFGLWAKWKDPV